MTDGTPMGTGNSRKIKSNISASTTWEQFRAALIAGTLPIDLLFNADGWDVVGTALNKANLLTDATAVLLGLTSSATVNDALEALSGRSKIEIVSYVGTGTYGQSNPNSLTFDFTPKVVIMLGEKGINVSTPYWNDFPISYTDFNTKMVSDALSTTYQKQFGFAHSSPSSSYGKKSADGKTVSWYSTYGAQGQMNSSGMTYYCMAIG